MVTDALLNDSIKGMISQFLYMPGCEITKKKFRFPFGKSAPKIGFQKTF